MVQIGPETVTRSQSNIWRDLEISVHWGSPSTQGPRCEKAVMSHPIRLEAVITNHYWNEKNMHYVDQEQQVQNLMMVLQQTSDSNLGSHWFKGFYHKTATSPPGRPDRESNMFYDSSYIRRRWSEVKPTGRQTPPFPPSPCSELRAVLACSCPPNPPTPTHPSKPQEPLLLLTVSIYREYCRVLAASSCFGVPVSTWCVCFFKSWTDR